MKIDYVRIETTITEEENCYAADFEDGKRGHELRNAGALQAGKDKRTDSPLELTEETRSC